MKFFNVFFQGIKFLLVGAFATLADLVFFQLFVWIIIPNLLIAKSISFLISVAIKYGGNKYWTFQIYDKERLHKEIPQFLFITLVALAIDLATFYYLSADKQVQQIVMQFGIPSHLWTQMSVIIAALSSALISFLGYKFLVFKK